MRISTEKSRLTADYDELHQRWTKTHNIGSPIKFVRDGLIYKKLRTLPPGHTLEAGCGTGAYSFFLAKNKHRVDAFDPSPIAIKALSKLCEGISVNYSINTIENFASSQLYDNILCLEVLEHIKDDKKALAQLSSLLRAGGKILISVPASPFLFGREDIKSGHIRRYTKKTLIELLNNAGLQDIHIYSYGFPILFIYATLRNIFKFHKITSRIEKIENYHTLPREFISMLCSFLLYFDSLNIPVGSVGYVAICTK